MAAGYGLRSSTMKSATNSSAEVPLINGKSPSTSCYCQWIQDVVVCSCNECCQQLLWPMSCIISIYFLTVQHYPEDPHTARSVKRAVRAPCAARTELDTGLMVVQLPGNMPNTSAVKFSALDGRTVTSRSLSDLQVNFRDIDCVWCWKLEVQNFEVLSLAIGVCMAITAADARVWRCLWVLGMGHWFWSNAGVPGWQTDKLMLNLKIRPQPDRSRTTSWLEL